jgi:hypothetical protein
MPRAGTSAHCLRLAIKAPLLHRKTNFQRVIFTSTLILSFKLTREFCANPATFVEAVLDDDAATNLADR